MPRTAKPINNNHSPGSGRGKRELFWPAPRTLTHWGRHGPEPRGEPTAPALLPNSESEGLCGEIWGSWHGAGAGEGPCGPQRDPDTPHPPAPALCVPFPSQPVRGGDRRILSGHGRGCPFPWACAPSRGAQRSSSEVGGSGEVFTSCPSLRAGWSIGSAKYSQAQPGGDFGTVTRGHRALHRHPVLPHSRTDIDGPRVASGPPASPETPPCSPSLSGLIPVPMVTSRMKPTRCHGLGAGQEGCEGDASTPGEGRQRFLTPKVHFFPGTQTLLSLACQHLFQHSSLKT